MARRCTRYWYLSIGVGLESMILRPWTRQYASSGGWATFARLLLTSLHLQIERFYSRWCKAVCAKIFADFDRVCGIIIGVRYRYLMSDCRIDSATGSHDQYRYLVFRMYRLVWGCFFILAAGTLPVEAMFLFDTAKFQTFMCCALFVESLADRNITGFTGVWENKDGMAINDGGREREE